MYEMATSGTTSSTPQYQTSTIDRCRQYPALPVVARINSGAVAVRQTDVNAFRHSAEKRYPHARKSIVMAKAASAWSRNSPATTGGRIELFQVTTRAATSSPTDIASVLT